MTIHCHICSKIHEGNPSVNYTLENLIQNYKTTHPLPFALYPWKRDEATGTINVEAQEYTLILDPDETLDNTLPVYMDLVNTTLKTMVHRETRVSTAFRDNACAVIDYGRKLYEEGESDKERILAEALDYVRTHRLTLSINVARAYDMIVVGSAVSNRCWKLTRMCYATVQGSRARLDPLTLRNNLIEMGGTLVRLPPNCHRYLEYAKMHAKLGWSQSTIGWSLFFFVMDVAHLSYRKHRGELSWRTWGKKIAADALITVASFAVGCAGSALGGAVGLALSSFVSIPFITPMLGGLLGLASTSLLLTYATSLLVDKVLCISEDERKDMSLYEKSKIYKNACEVLDLTENASKRDFYKKRNALMLYYHPDKDQSVGEEEKKRKIEQFIKTVTAFEIVQTYRKELGTWNLLVG